MLLLYKLLCLIFFHYSLYLPMMRRERKRSVNKLAYLTVCIASVLTPFFRNLISLFLLVIGVAQRPFGE